MAYFKAKNLKLGTDQSIYFGDSDQARLWFDGAEWAATHTISGTAATAGYHLIQKQQVDDSIGTLSGTLTNYIDNHTWTENDITDLDKYTQSEVDSLITSVSGSIITDHGGLTGLGDDDHTQYSLADGTRAFTGVVGGITPTDGSHLTTKDYVDSLAQGLDWQDSVITQSVSDPTTISGVSAGDRYIIGPSATGAWAGNDDGVAEWTGSSWDIETPNEGFATWVEDEDVLYVYNGAAWVKFGSTVDHGNLIGLSDDDHTQYTLADGTRDFSGKVSYNSHPTFTTDEEIVDKKYVDDQIDTLSSGIVLDHGSLTGLGDDDHTQYTLVDGTRGFTGTVSGIDPTASYHLTTKQYVDDHTWTENDITDLDKYTQSEVDALITNVSGSIITDHGGLSGLGDDDHTQYILVDGTRGFTNTVSGVDPTQDYHLTTKQYVDDAITTATGSLTTDHGSLTGLSDDDHTQYILVDGTRGFTATVSGVDPTQDYHLATKSYVDSVSTDKVQTGRVSLAYHDESKAVTFGTAFADTNYSVSAILNNTTDSDPGIYPMVVSAKSTTGFTVIFSGKIDSNNYYVEWIAQHD